MIIRMIRHFATKGNLEKRYIGVTDEGIITECVPERALKKNDTEQKWEPEIVIVSPLRRCQQSAEKIFPEVKQVVCDKLRECDFGSFEGKNYLELTGNEAYQRWIDSGGTIPFPEGEDPMEFRKRCVRGFLEMTDKAIKENRKRIAYVVHGGTIMSIMEAFDPDKREFYYWQVKNGSGFQLRIEEQEWRNGRRKFEEIEKI